MRAESLFPLAASAGWLRGNEFSSFLGEKRGGESDI